MNNIVVIEENEQKARELVVTESGDEGFDAWLTPGVCVAELLSETATINYPYKVMIDFG